MNGDVDQHDHRRRRRWFDLGVRAIGALLPDLGDFYVCPCCLKLLGQDALDDRRLTVEHVPPESLGGKPLVLTCDQCNSAAGHQLDAHAERAEAHIDLMRGTASRPLRGTITVAGTSLVGEVLATPDGIKFLGVPRANHPDRPGEVVDVMNEVSGADTARLEIGFTSREPWNRRAASMSWVRAAYLVGFALLGYRYILQPEFEALRAGLADPSNAPAHIPVATEEAQARVRRGAFVITEPAWLHSLTVQIGRHTVFLPARFPDSDFFDRLSADLGAKRRGLEGTWEVVGMGWPSEPEFRMDNS